MLFKVGDFTLASGAKSSWKIECDGLTKEDWAGLAAIAAERLPPFGDVVGVPRGGLPFSDALVPYITPGESRLLIAEDVVTTGGSIERFRASVYPHRIVWGVAAFARGVYRPDWVTALFVLTPAERPVVA